MAAITVVGIPVCKRKYDVSTVSTLLYPKIEPYPSLLIWERDQYHDRYPDVTSLPTVFLQTEEKTQQLRLRKDPERRIWGYIWQKRRMLTLQGLSLMIALFLSYIASIHLAPWPVYRIVAFIVIGILWSNAASSVARKKSVDILTTMSLQAIRIKNRKRNTHMESPALTQDTTTYLQTIKAAFLGRI